MRTRFLLLTAALLLTPTWASALKFPDVPSSYVHANAVQQLSDKGVIGGNPDGTFRPHDPVNRAAMLKMLYQAAGITPQRVGGCFPDVQEGSWYELYVCDASVRGYVQGYTAVDGKRSFKPAQAVTRAEAIKLTLVILDVPQAKLDTAVSMYTDVSATDWFAPYVHTAIAKGLLPIAGQEAGPFHPGQILERGEAAAYIWNGVQADKSVPEAEASSSSVIVSEEQSSNASGGESAESIIAKRAAAAMKVQQQEDAALKRAQENTRSVSVPFTDKQIFNGKEPFSYEFTVTDVTVVDINAALLDWNMGVVHCRLYHLGRSGFSQEYFLGFEDGKNCLIRGALSPGNWRLQLEPTQLAPTFTVSAKIAKGDGNDGFPQAAMLPLMQVRTGDLGEGDLEDWYKFTVPNDAKTSADGGRRLMLSVTSAMQLGCLIYPLDDVDIYGFANPDCEHTYLFPPGSYMVSIRHAQPLSSRQSFSVQIK